MNVGGKRNLNPLHPQENSTPDPPLSKKSPPPPAPDKLNKASVPVVPSTLFVGRGEDMPDLTRNVPEGAGSG